jgi:AraC-like DNA-binding protein
VRPASGTDNLGAGRPGLYNAGETWLHFCAERDVWGVVLWGRPTAVDLAKLVASLKLELGDAVLPHGSLIDARRVEGAEPGAFGLLAEYVKEHRGGLARKVARLALVRPNGMAGAIVAGFFEVLPKPYPVRTFVEVSDALSWLGESREAPLDAAALAAALDRAHAESAGTSPVLSQLRAVLDRRLTRETSLADAAHALATSERTLQRRLSESKTTLSDEIALAKVRAAKRRMLETDDPLTTIALDIGCASLQHFGQLFRRFEGVSPSAWRTEHKQT